MDIGITGLLLSIIIFFVSYKGLRDHAFFERYEFAIDPILVQKQYNRIITAGFLHLNWMHLVINLVSLLLISVNVELMLGPVNFLIIYFASLIGGHLLALFIHRTHGDYSAVGASGAVSGLLFAIIAVMPGSHLGLFFLPISLPAWLYGLLYILYSIYGIRSKRDNIGHEAHLGGALIGMLTAIIIHPSSLVENFATILLIALPTLAFITIIIAKPHLLLIDNLFFRKHHPNYTIDQRYNAERANTQQEVDRILEKIHQKGIKSLTQKEREVLERYSSKK